MSPLAQLIAAGVELEGRSNGKLRASGFLTDSLRALIRAHKSEILTELAGKESTVPTHYAWWVTPPDGPAFEVRILPEQTRAEVEARYPGVTLTPMTETVR